MKLLLLFEFGFIVLKDGLNELLGGKIVEYWLLRDGCKYWIGCLCVLVLADGVSDSVDEGREAIAAAVGGEIVFSFDLAKLSSQFCYTNDNTVVFFFYLLDLIYFLLNGLFPLSAVSELFQELNEILYGFFGVFAGVYEDSNDLLGGFVVGFIELLIDFK